MLNFIRFAILSLVIPFFSLCSQEIVRLQYLPNVSVHYVSEINGLIDSQFGTEISTTSYEQVLKGALAIDSDDIDLSIDTPPIDLTYVFKGFRAQVVNGDSSLEVDTDFPEDSIAAEALVKLINHPIHLHFGEDFILEKGTHELKNLERRMGVFEQFDYSDVLEDLFQNLFLLADLDLSIGTKVTSGESNGFVLEVIAITDTEVQASIFGEIQNEKIEWSQDDCDIVMEISGDVRGHIVWKRVNALEYTSETQTNLTTKIAVGGQKGVLTTHLVHDVHAFR